jgi:protein ImuA
MGGSSGTSAWSTTHWPWRPEAGRSMESHRLEAALAPLLAAGLVARAGAPASDVRPAGSAAGLVVPTGAPALDSWLPAGGLARAGLHEFTGDPPGYAPLALATILAARSDGPVIWIRLLQAGGERGLPYAYGLAQLGLDPDRLVLVETPKPLDALWAAEESLRARCAGAVLLDGLAPDLTAQRRLLLAAEQGEGPLLAAYAGGRAAGSSAATTRWRVASVAAGGATRFQVALERCRGGRAGRSWLLDWSETDRALHEATAPSPLGERAGERGRTSSTPSSQAPSPSRFADPSLSPTGRGITRTG